MEKLFKEPEGIIYNGGAILYAITGYIIGFFGLFNVNIIINILSALLLGHAMIIAAYLIHECAHNLVFKKIRFNTYLGRFFSWICGSSYGTYKDIQYKHFRHHVDVDDVVWFDYEAFFKKNPKVVESDNGSGVETSQRQLIPFELETQLLFRSSRNQLTYLNRLRNFKLLSTSMVDFYLHCGLRSHSPTSQGKSSSRFSLTASIFFPGDSRNGDSAPWSRLTI